MPVEALAYYIVFNTHDIYFIDGLMQKKQSTSVLAQELCLFYIKLNWQQCETIL